MDRAWATTPSRRRAVVVLAAELGAYIAIEVLARSVVLAAVWCGVVAATGLLLLHDGTGGTANLASILAGRPIALTARGREFVNTVHISAIRRQTVKLTLLCMLSVLLLFSGLVLLGQVAGPR